jgi:hypothetical protein
MPGLPLYLRKADLMRERRRWRLLRLTLAVIAVTLGIGVTAVIVPEAASASIPDCLAGEIVGIAPTADGNGYWLAGTDGGVFSYGDAKFFGSMAGRPLNKPIVGIVSTADGNGYWLIGADGGVFAFGDAAAPSGNPLPGMKLNAPVVGAARAGTSGLELTAGDGGVFALGGAPYLGSIAGRPLNKPVVGIVSTADGNGYWLIGADGGVFAFGDAAAPSGNPLPGMKLNAPVVGAARAGTSGLELTAGDGGVFALGGAPYLGSMAGQNLAKPVSGIAVKPGNAGYWLTARDGGVFAFGNAGFYGNAVSTSCTVPPTSGSVIVQYATAIMNGQAESGWGGGAVPYSWGGGHATNPGPSKGTCVGYTGSIQPCPAQNTTGVDCSGFARWVYSLAYGHDVLGGGNTNEELSRMNKVSAPTPGDLVFYGISVHDTHHVGIYIGNGKMIDALKTGTHVEQDSVSGMSNFLGYWQI